MSNPYSVLGDDAFWRSAIGGRNPLEVEDLWKPAIMIDRADKIVTAGSCFAQHIGRALSRNGFNWFNAEPGPGTAELNRKYSYGVFSFRTGNIYTAALLRQWIEWAFELRSESQEAWEDKGRFYDPFRPTVEPNGFGSLGEMRAARQSTLAAIRRAVVEAKVFVFTLGLTEAWINSKTGEVYASCPGTAAGNFDPSLHSFHNCRAPEIQRDLEQAIIAMRQKNPGLQILLTVSPVPLTATASGKHVLVATTYSKSVLRAVAGDMCEALPSVDYFPSYEIITAPAFRGIFFQPNAREVSPKGVEFVMTHFFAGLGSQNGADWRERPPPDARELRRRARRAEMRLKGTRGTARKDSHQDDVVCEEAMLEAFAKP